MKAGNRLFRLIFAGVLTVYWAWVPAANADWGSLRAANRTERGPAAGRGPRKEQRATERRRLGIEPERRAAFFWAAYRPGMVLPGLPRGYMQVSAGPNGYFYFDGVFYQFTTAGYAVITAPVGAIVPQLPEGAEQVMAGPVTYYYAAGAFFLPQTPAGFAVVAPPAGATVTGLPAGATAVTMHGRVYYVSGTTYFMPVMQGGVTVYVTTQP